MVEWLRANPCTTNYREEDHKKKGLIATLFQQQAKVLGKTEQQLREWVKQKKDALEKLTSDRNKSGSGFTMQGGENI